MKKETSEMPIIKAMLRDYPCYINTKAIASLFTTSRHDESMPNKQMPVITIHSIGLAFDKCGLCVDDPDGSVLAKIIFELGGEV